MLYKRTFLQCLLTSFVFVALDFSPITWANAPNTNRANVDVSNDFTQAQGQCGQPGQVWNSQLNRCILTQDAYDTREAHKECLKAPDPQECFDQLAETATGVPPAEEQELIDATEAGLIANAYAWSSTVLGKISGSGGGGCTSSTLLKVASAAWLGADLLLKKSAKKELEDNAKKYRKEAKSEESKSSEDSSFEAQVRAFKYQREQQEIIKKHSNKRKNIQRTLTVAFGGIMVAAALEVAPLPPLPCVTVRQIGPVEVGSSWGIAAAAGTFLFWSNKIADGAKKQAQQAELNIQKIDETIAGFRKSISGHCPDGRDDLNNDRCFCYNQDGGQNPNRTNLATCQNLYKKDQETFHIPPNDYSTIGNTGAAEGCLTENAKFDPECRCLNMKNTETGEDACYRSKPINGLSFNGPPGALEAIGDTNQILDGLARGTNHALAKFSGKKLAQMASRNQRVNSELLKKLGRRNKNKSRMIENSEKIARQLLRRPVLKANNISAANLAKETLPSGSSAAVGASLAKVDAEGKNAAGPGGGANGGSGASSSLSGGKGLDGINDQKKDETSAYQYNDSDFSSGGHPRGRFQASGYGGLDSADASSDENAGWFDFKKDPTVKDRAFDLWEVITQRYFRSGYKRLFGNEKRRR